MFGIDRTIFSLYFVSNLYQYVHLQDIHYHDLEGLQQRFFYFFADKLEQININQLDDWPESNCFPNTETEPKLCCRFVIALACLETNQARGGLFRSLMDGTGNILLKHCLQLTDWIISSWMYLENYNQYVGLLFVCYIL